MDANYQFKNIRVGNGYVRINVNLISEIIIFPNGKDIYLVMASGKSYIAGGKSAKKILELTKYK